MANVCLKLHREFLNQAQQLLEDLRHEGQLLETSGKRPKAPDAVRAFRERQLRYWNRCDWASIKGQLDANEQPDDAEQWLDVLEESVFHPHVLVVAIAEAAISALGHLCLVWAGLALQVEPVRRPATVTTRVQIQTWNRSEAERQHMALTHLVYALEKFQELPMQKWASLLNEEDWTYPLADNLNMVEYLWGNVEDAADTIIAESFDRLHLPEPTIKFSPIAAQINQALPSHASSHATIENDAKTVQTTTRRKPKLSLK